MKRIAAIILPVLVCLLLCANVTADDKKVNVSIGQASANAGDTIVLEVKIDGNTGFSYLNLQIEYDSAQLSLVEAENNGILENRMFTGSQYIYVNPYYLVWTGLTDTKENGKIAELTFRVQDKAVTGNTEIKIIHPECWDTATAAVNVQTQNGQIAIKGQNPPTGGVPTNTPTPGQGTAGNNTPAPNTGTASTPSAAGGTADPNATPAPSSTAGENASKPNTATPKSGGSPAPTHTSEDSKSASKLWLLLLLIIPVGAAVYYVIYKKKKR